MNTLTKLLLLAGAGAAIIYVPTILAVRNLTVRIISVLPTNIDGNRVDFLVTVKLKNNSNFRINLQHIVADVILNGTKIAQFGRDQQIPILAYSEQNINVTFSVDAKVVGDKLWQELLAQNLQNFVLDVTGSLTANNKTFPFNTNWTIEDVKNSIGATKVMSAKESFFWHLGLNDFEFVEPFGSLWKSRGKKIYVRHKRSNTGAIAYLERQNFIQSVQEAGGDNVLAVTLK